MTLRLLITEAMTLAGESHEMIQSCIDRTIAECEHKLPGFMDQPLDPDKLDFAKEKLMLVAILKLAQKQADAQAAARKN